MIKISKHPFPYKAAMSLSSDVEFMTWKAQLEIFKIFEKYRIPVAHSLFFFATNFLCHSTFSYFLGTSGKLSHEAPEIRDKIKAGLFDTIHAYGDFDGGGFTRKHAELVYDECVKHNLSFDIFTSHGSDLNSQNIGYVGLQNAPYHGDDVNHESYHADITRKIGVRYFWPNSSALMPKPYSKTPILELRKSADGVDHVIFNRYRGLVGKAAPNISTFAEQIEFNDLLKLIKVQGTCIYYQHLGVWEKRQDGSFEENRPPYFTKEGFERIEQIADLYHSKDLWIETTGKLLRYTETRDNLSFFYDKNTKTINLNVSNIPDIKYQHFNNITFVIDKIFKIFNSNIIPQAINWQGRDLPFEVFDTYRYTYLKIKIGN